MAFKCEICMQSFDSLERIPMNLKCGHSFCKECISKLINDNLPCALCKKKIEYKSISEVPVSFTILEYCTDNPANEDSASNIFNLQFNPKFSAGSCIDHGGFPLDKWCCLCKKWVCITCIIMNCPSQHENNCEIKMGSSAFQSVKSSELKKFGNILN